MRVYGGWLDRLPWWGAAVLGLLAVVIGFGITLKPFSSLGVLVVLVAVAFVIVGLGEVSSAQSSAGRWAGVAWIAAGTVVAVWPGLTRFMGWRSLRG